MKIDPVLIIAEAGVNHNGDRDLAFGLVEAAAEAGADAIKFQTFRAETLVTKTASKADYQKRTTGTSESQFQMLAQLELNNETHVALKKHSEQLGLLFISTAFDKESLAFLSRDLQLEILKIPSGELTNGPFLLEFSRTGKQLILSTGMATVEEIKKALSVLAFGLCGGSDPSTAIFSDYYNSHEGQCLLKERVVLLHCTSEYPASIESLDMRSITILRDVFSLKVGYSDHSEGIQAACVATSMGAVVIEKHLTLDRSLTGPDHQASLEPGDFGNMVDIIRSTELMMGDGQKTPSAAEISNRSVARKSLIAARDILQGEMFTNSNVAVKRPGTGRSPMEYWSVIGTRSKRSYSKDELI